MNNVIYYTLNIAAGTIITTAYILQVSALF